MDRPEERAGDMQPVPYRVVHVFRRGRATVPDPVPSHVALRALCGNVTVDLRHHRFTEAVTEIHVYSFLGMVNLYLPYGVNVENASTGLFGAFGGNARYAVGFNGPHVHLRGVAMLGGVGAYIVDASE